MLFCLPADCHCSSTRLLISLCSAASCIVFCSVLLCVAHACKVSLHSFMLMLSASPLQACLLCPLPAPFPFCSVVLPVSDVLLCLLCSSILLTHQMPISVAPFYAHSLRRCRRFVLLFVDGANHAITSHADILRATFVAADTIYLRLRRRYLRICRFQEGFVVVVHRFLLS